MRDREPAIADDARPLLHELAAFHPQSWGWALHCCGRRRDEAQDVLQEAYCRAASRAGAFAGGSSLRTWFFGIVRRTALEAHRRGARTARWSDRDGDAVRQEPGRDLERDEERSRLQRCLARIAPRQREVLHLVFYQELTVEQAATVMGVSPGTARQHYHRGKQALRRLLTAEGAQP